MFSILKKVFFYFGKNWSQFGSTLLSVDKLTFKEQEKVLVEVELSHSPQTEVEWIVDSTIIGGKYSK